MKTGIVEYAPDDMTVTVEADLTLAALQTELARHQQWLPLDPPHSDRLTIGELINNNASGPRRFGYGAIRDHMIGIKVALAGGTIIHSGGKVVKNVAGFDLMKLFIGARGSLGTVKEATFKLWPLPEEERFIANNCADLESAEKRIEAVIASAVTPTVMDLHNLNRDAITIVLGFAGTREEVAWQLMQVEKLGFTEPASLDFEEKFWSDDAPAQRRSVLPSKLIQTIRGLRVPFIARAGNGIIYHRGPAAPRQEELPLKLLQRIKDAYDPKHILPDLPL